MNYDGAGALGIFVDSATSRVHIGLYTGVIIYGPLLPSLLWSMSFLFSLGLPGMLSLFEEPCVPPKVFCIPQTKGNFDGLLALMGLSSPKRTLHMYGVYVI